MKARILLTAAVLLFAAGQADAQGWYRQPTPNDTLKSVRTLPDGRAVFSIYAPAAKTVAVAGDGDLIPYFGENKPVVERQENGVWTATVKGVQPGCYRYHFVVDGLNVYDPKGELASETSAIAYIGSGDEFFATRKVPHGAMSQRVYWSETLGCWRRMHVWTPAGYEKSAEALPVLYLIHGGGDTDNSWPGVGAAGNILDNLMAEGKIKPMVVVMPNGTVTGVPNEVPPFAQDMVTSIIPFVEQNYRVLTDKDSRAIAGLSMGGMETMEVAFNNIDKFSYVWVLSSSMMPGQDPAAESERLGVKKNAQRMNASFRQLVFTQGGQADIAYKNCENTRAQLSRDGLKFEYRENSQAGHSWTTWRLDLLDLAQKIFR